MSDEKVYRIKSDFDWQHSPKGRGIFADTPVGRFNIHTDSYLPRWFVQLRTGDQYAFCEEAKTVESIEVGKTLARAWYVERMAAGLEEVVIEEQKTVSQVLREWSNATAIEREDPTLTDEHGEEVRFDALSPGDQFDDDGQIMLRTRDVADTIGVDDGCSLFNCVRLIDGSLHYTSAGRMVRRLS